jgi:hypothetical protein
MTHNLRNFTACNTLIAALTLASCGGSTAEQLTSFSVSIVTPAGPIVADDGFAIELEQATLQLAAVRFYSGEPLFSSRLRAPFRFGSLLAAALCPFGGSNTAHAHPGHYQEGSALAELLHPVSVDLLATKPIDIGQANGVTGTYRSMKIVLGAKSGSPTLRIGGVAKLGAKSVRFAADLTIDESIDGISVEEGFARGNGAALIEVSVASWLARIDFEALRQSGCADNGKTCVIDTNQPQAHNALLRGLKNTGAYRARWTK